MRGGETNFLTIKLIFYCPFELAPLRYMANSEYQQFANKSVFPGLSKSIFILRLIGYGLIVFGILDFLDIVIPPNFTNPIWEFDMLGKLVERVPVPLIGLVLAFMGEQEGRQKGELALLKYVSWLALIAGFLYILLVPLGVFNTFRINNSNNQQIKTRENRGLNQVKTIQKRLQGVTTFEEMEAFLQGLDQNGGYPEITDAQQFKTVKKDLNSSFEQSKKDLTLEASNKRTNQQLKLFKKSFKWNLGALISSLLFLSIWRGTPWAR